MFVRMKPEDWLEQDLKEIREAAESMLRNDITASQYDQKMLRLTTRLRLLVVERQVTFSMGSD